MTYDIAIITVSSNKLLDECLASVARAMRTSPLRTCFVLVDNGSTAFSAYAKVRSIIPDAVIILRDRNYGFGRSCNRGTQEIDARYYFFLNPDTELVAADALDRFYAFMHENPRAGIVAPRIQHFSGEHQETCRRFPAWYMPIVQRTWLARTKFGQRYTEHFLMRTVPYQSTRLIDWAQGSALFMSAELFLTLGGFDEGFWMYFEDIDLCRRAWEQYRPVYYFPDVVVRHLYGKASDVSKNYVHQLLVNRALRAHLMSWIKYFWKWRSPLRFTAEPLVLK